MHILCQIGQQESYVVDVPRDKILGCILRSLGRVKTPSRAMPVHSSKVVTAATNVYHEWGTICRGEEMRLQNVTCDAMCRIMAFTRSVIECTVGCSCPRINPLRFSRRATQSV